MFNYKPYLQSLASFMAKKGYTTSPFPKIILDDKKQDGVFILTGYFDPEADGIRLFIHDRHPKDVLRTFAHELIHWKQQNEGRLGKGAYSGDKITEDKKLVKLEEEAYLKGNIAFRSWTETMQKTGELDESINLKKKNEGKFTATKKATGKSTEELTHSKNPITKKRAIFAQNAKKWNHSK